MLSAPDRLVSEQLRDIADELDKRLLDVAGQSMNFSLLIFQAEEGSRMNYISNCERDSVLQALKSLVHGWEQGMPDIKAHEVN